MRRQDKISGLVACGLALAVCGMALADGGFVPQGNPVSPGSSPTFVVVTTTDIETSTVSANDGTLAQTIADSTGNVTFAGVVTAPAANLLGANGVVQTFVGTTNASIVDGVLSTLEVNAATGLVVSDGGDGIADGTLSLSAVTGSAQTTDAAPTATVITGNDAAGAVAVTGTNDDAGPLILSGGLQKVFSTVLDWTSASTETLTVSTGIAGVTSAIVMTNGTEFTAATSNGATAISIAAYIDTSVAGVSAAAVGDIVYMTPDSTVHSIDIATSNAAVWSVTEGTAGVVSVVSSIEQEEQAGHATIGTYTATEILDVSGSETTSGLIPAGAWNIRACARNTSTIVATTGVSYTIGISGGDVDAFGTGIVLTDTNSTDSTDWTALVGWAAAGREIVVIPNAGTLDSGTIQIVVFYDLLTAQSED